MQSSSEYRTLIERPESPCPTEIISLSDSSDNSTSNSDTESDSSLPSLRDVLRPRQQSITDGRDTEGGAQQESQRRQSRHRCQNTAKSGGSVEIAESSSDQTSDLQIPGITTVRTSKGDSPTERPQQQKLHIGKRPSSLTLERQLDPERKSKRDSQVEYRVEMLANVGGSDVLGIYGQRETNQGREYRCLIGAWLHPNDGIPHGEIQKYNREVIQSTRRQSLRKRKCESDHYVTDTRILQKVRQWKADV
ncbi:hypothetical protein LTR70_007431 [Exophiala xenobiotica]|uniref:Uncharacterized protein n=1 Tax=Lithohypha guttulata TaxID=1690604 RepID=A0ABR0K666_9EURO|nr:hypothetical protein LTR24_006971 [Lithohypha guttulata]KAK5313788.1 hypothetical protein LTR70_007431 [Exophiala xenobiotica]